MLTEDYCDFETAKLLKEKGFDEPVMHHFTPDGTQRKFQQAFYRDDVAQPTLQMATKWLREKHKLFIDITAAMEDYIEGGVVKYKDPYYTWEVFSLEFGETLCFGGTPNVKETYEEACESAIKYCLENLI